MVLPPCNPAFSKTFLNSLEEGEWQLASYFDIFKYLLETRLIECKVGSAHFEVALVEGGNWISGWELEKWRTTRCGWINNLFRGII